MARAIWSGSISFGLLNVPVRMYSAVARRNIALREIRASDSSRTSKSELPSREQHGTSGQSSTRL